MSKEKRSIGHLVFNEMWRFRFSNSKRMTVPYPCLVSRILDIHQVWYLVETVEHPIPFSDQHFSRMNIDVVKVHSLPTKKRKTTSASSKGQDEAQSAAPPPSPSGPSFAHAAMQHFLEAEFAKMSEALITIFSNHFKTYMDTLLVGANDHFAGKNFDANLRAVGNNFLTFKDDIFEKIDGLNKTVAGLDSRVASIEQFIRDSRASTSAPPPASSDSPEDPPSDVLMAMIDFSTPILNPEPQPIPAPPLSSVAPSDPIVDPIAEEPQPTPVPDSSSPQSPLV